MLPKITFLVFAAFLTVINCLAQSTQVTIVKGRIINAVSGEVVSYATITDRLHGINTMSNEKGDFLLKIPPGVSTDSLMISHIGFQPVIVYQNTSMMIIRLQPKTMELQEVVVKVPDALALVKKAIEKIPDNYANKPYMMHGFYRLTGTEEKRIIQMSEAAFQIYNADYARKNKQVKLIKARIDKDLTAFNGNDDFHFGTSPKGLLDIDIVSNANANDIIHENGIKQYQFIYKGTTQYNGAEAHVIFFDQKDGIRKSLNQGRMIIDAQSLAFLEFSFRLSPKGIKYWSFPGAPKLLMKLARLQIDMLQDSFKVTYQKYGDKYYLGHVQETTLWHIMGGKEHFELDPLRMRYNYLVTKIDTTNASPFESQDLMRPTRFMEMTVRKNITDSIDPFWDEYNLILPEFDVDSAARIIHQNNETLNFKAALEKRLSKIKGDKIVRIDSILAYYHGLNQFNGSALVEYDGKIIFSKSFGPADKEKNIQNNVHTQFRIGSATKSFTAVLIMQLADEKKLSVTDTVGRFLPGYVHGHLTIEQLLTHQSGIPNYTNNEDYLAKIILNKYTTIDLVKFFCSDPLEFVPGTAFNYSNSGYVVLAAIIERITGQTYANVLHDKIFVPAGMKNSFFGLNKYHDQRFAGAADSLLRPTPLSSSTSSQMAIGYVNGEPEISFPIENITGAGGISSTTGDLLLYNHAITAGSLLSPESTKAIFQPRVNWKEWDADYGYGWMLDRGIFDAGTRHEIQYHPGTEPGFFTMMIRQPDKKITIILLNNKGEFPRFDIADLILNELN
jgi:CubicO group peptidase (beta-lactamase class C family)